MTHTAHTNTAHTRMHTHTHKLHIHKKEHVLKMRLISPSETHKPANIFFSLTTLFACPKVIRSSYHITEEFILIIFDPGKF